MLPHKQPDLVPSSPANWVSFATGPGPRQNRVDTGTLSVRRRSQSHQGRPWVRVHSSLAWEASLPLCRPTAPGCSWGQSGGWCQGQKGSCRASSGFDQRCPATQTPHVPSSHIFYCWELLSHQQISHSFHGFFPWSHLPRGK